MREPGLKTVCQQIAAVFGVDCSLLHEKQRRLTAEGLLTARPGKGPGSGVAGTPENLAILLSAFFAGRPANEVSSITASARDFALTKQAWRRT